MDRKKTKNLFTKILKELHEYTDRFWYAPLIAILAAIDNFIIVIPTDGILVSSCMISPKKWFILSTMIALGSTIGAILLCGIVTHNGLFWVLEVYPQITSTSLWLFSVGIFE